MIPLDTDDTVIGELTLRLARVGRRSDVAFVLLHGYPDTLQVFAPLARALAATGEVVAFDWPGQGGSAPAANASSPDERADVLARVIDAVLPGRRVVAIAHDMGALPALSLAARGDQRLMAVVAANALLVPDAPVSPEIRLLRTWRSYRFALRFAWRQALARCLATFLPRTCRVPDALRNELTAAFQRRPVREQTIAACERYDDALPHWRRIAAAIEIPVLLLWGEHERHFNVAHARRFAAVSPRADVEVVAGGHHWMAWHDPDRVASRIIAWLTRRSMRTAYGREPNRG